MELRGVIFDLDGVIVDTISSHFQAWKKMFSEYGKHFTFKDYKLRVDGIPRVDGAKAVLEGLSEPELEKAAAKKQKYFLDSIKKQGVRVYPESLALIAEMRTQKIRTAVISSSRSCRFILRKASLTGYFDTVVSGEEVKNGKPNPDIFLLAASRLNLPRKNCLAFEDAVLGVEACRRAGIRCVGVDRYSHPRRLAAAAMVIRDLSEVDIFKLNKLLKHKKAGF